jgi:hypothetical protein
MQLLSIIAEAAPLLESAAISHGIVTSNDFDKLCQILAQRDTSLKQIATLDTTTIIPTAGNAHKLLTALNATNTAKTCAFYAPMPPPQEVASILTAQTPQSNSTIEFSLPPALFR